MPGESNYVDLHDRERVSPSRDAGSDDAYSYGDLYSDVNFEEIRFAPSLDRPHVDLEILKVLGQGQFGVVWKGISYTGSDLLLE